MAQLVVLRDDKFYELAEIIDGGGIVVFMPESLATQHGLETGDPRADDYECGGEGDVWVDMVSSEAHYFFSHLADEAQSEVIGS